MKKVIFAFAVVTVLLQSCSNGKMFNKKRYGHLNWIDRGYKMEDSKDSKIEDVVFTEEENTKDAVVKNEIATSTPTTPTVNQTVVATEIQVQENNTQKSAAPAMDQPVMENSISENELPSSTLSEKSENIVVKSFAEPKLDGDGKLILCIILCFFIPPLAMYVWDQNTDLWFVVDLVLFLFWIFWFLGYMWGFAALCSVVIALLRVLELI